MKSLKSIMTLVSAVIVTMLFAAPVNGQTNKTETFKVAGECGMCKTRIEKALKTDGVTSAVWNKENKMATVTFDPSKVKVDDLHKKVAAVGHDTEKAKAEDKVYDALPGCCKYERLK